MSEKKSSKDKDKVKIKHLNAMIYKRTSCEFLKFNF
jgi:hypothetical protein